MAQDRSSFWDIQANRSSVSPQFTAALLGYSGTFMRYSMAVTPKNYLLFACHFVNFNAQLTQLYRWYDFNYKDGKTKWDNLKLEGERQADVASKDVQGLVNKAEDKAQQVIQDVKKKVS